MYIANNFTCRVYTTMLGKKSSVSILKEALRMKGVSIADCFEVGIGALEMCPGSRLGL